MTARTPRPAATPTEGTLLDGRVLYHQLSEGYRTGIEPVLLAATIPALPGQTVLEAGTGAGAGLLCLAARVPGLIGIGIERDPVMAGLARRNLAANGHAFTIMQADVTAAPAAGPVHHAFANPPWHEPGSSRSPEPRRAGATHRGQAGLTPWIESLAAAIDRKGTVSLALPAALAGQAMALLHDAGLGRLVLAPLWPRTGRPAKIVVIQARHGKGPSRIGPGLVLHGPGSAYTPEAEAILRGGAAFPL